MGNIFGKLAENTRLIKMLSNGIMFMAVLAGVVCAAAVVEPAFFGAFGSKVESVFTLVTGRFLLIGFGLTMLAYVIVLTIDALALGYEKSAIKSILNPDMSTKTDIWIFMLWFTGLSRYIIMLSVFMLGYFIDSKLSGMIQLNFVQDIDSLLIQSLVAFLIYDFFGYWRHRFGHRISWWWETHIHHHSAEKFNVITVGRSHPVDLALTDIFLVIPAIVFGVPLETLLALTLMKSMQGKLQHSMINWDFGIVGRYVLMSPVAHRIHHSPDPEHWDKNFGHFTVFWDRMFGTWYDGETVNDRVGLWHNHENKNGYVFDVVRGQFKFLEALFSKWKFSVGVMPAEKVAMLSKLYKAEQAKKKAQANLAGEDKSAEAVT